MSAITAALRQLDDVAAEGDLAPDPRSPPTRSSSSRPATRSCCRTASASTRRTLHGERVDALALALLDMDDPAALELPAPDRPARRGQEPDRPRDRLPAVDRPRPRGRGPPRRAVLRLRRDAARPELGRVLLPPRMGARRRLRRPGLAGGLGVRAGDARGLGGDDRRGQHRPRRLPALDQRHARRTPGAVPVGDRRDRDRPARVRGHPGLQPGPGRRDRHPRRLALALPGDARGHQPLGRAGRSSARPRRWCARRPRWTASGSPARTA